MLCLVSSNATIFFFFFEEKKILPKTLFFKKEGKEKQWGRGTRIKEEKKQKSRQNTYQSPVEKEREKTSRRAT